ncbi:hypothetical protein MC885_011477 [Smutsia gigantea]|nr:hypothetical protein MC885_011477 [Smutsia gigantea]
MGSRHDPRPPAGAPGLGERGAAAARTGARPSGAAGVGRGSSAAQTRGGGGGGGGTGGGLGAARRPPASRHGRRCGTEQLPAGRCATPEGGGGEARRDRWARPPPWTEASPCPSLVSLLLPSLEGPRDG